MKESTAMALVLVALLGIHGLASGAPAAPPDTSLGEPDSRAPLMQRAQELAATGQPLELLVASRLAYSQELTTCRNASGAPCESDVWLDQAIREGSDQPLIARVAVSRCIANTRRCDVPAAVQTLRTREADDVAAQLLLWRMAVVQGDAGEAGNAWTRVTQATRLVDEYAESLDLLERMTAGLRLPVPADAVGADPEQSRLTMVHALTGAFSTMVLGNIQWQCPAPADVARSEGCRHLLMLMAGSSDLLARSYGSAKMQVYARDAAEREHWQQQRRELAWISEKASALLGGEVEGGRVPNMQTYLRRSVELGELGAMQQLLAANRIPPKPPADWQPTVFPSK